MIRKFVLSLVATMVLVALGACGDEETTGETSSQTAPGATAEAANLPVFAIDGMRFGMTVKEVRDTCPSKVGESGFPLIWQPSMIEGLSVYSCPIAKPKRTVQVFQDDLSGEIAIIRVIIGTGDAPYDETSPGWSWLIDSYGLPEKDATGQYFWRGAHGTRQYIENYRKEDGTYLHRWTIENPAAMTRRPS